MYVKTTRTCGDRPTWQQGGSDGLVLAWDRHSRWWFIGPSSIFERSGVDGGDCWTFSTFIISGKHTGCGDYELIQPDDPCYAGKWLEGDGSSLRKQNPNFEVVPCTGDLTPIVNGSS